MSKISNIDYKLEGLKYVRYMLAEKDRVVAYSERCNPDPYGYNRRCNWSYGTVEYNMTNYPCPWDKNLMLNRKGKGGCHSTSGCFYRCFLRDSKTKESKIIEEKETYVEAIDNLISIMEKGDDWRNTLGKSSILNKKNKSLKYENKEKHKQNVESSVKNVVGELQDVSNSECNLSEIADKLIKFVKAKGIHVLRYDSKSSKSIYLKFDYGMAGSLRLSDTPSTNELRYTFNILSSIDKPYIESYVNDNKYAYSMYFYPVRMAQNVMVDVVRYKEYRQAKYGEVKYKKLLEGYKSNRDEKIGFWKKAYEV